MRHHWHFTGPGGSHDVRIHARLRTNNGDTCRAAALDHQGIVLQPDFIIGDDLRRGTLVELLPGYRALALGVHAVYPSRKHLPLKTRRMVAFLVEAFRPASWHD